MATTEDPRLPGPGISHLAAAGRLTDLRLPRDSGATDTPGREAIVLNPGETPPVEVLGDDEDDTAFTVQMRWMLTGGVEVVDEVAHVPAELRCGDLQMYASRGEALFEEMRRSGRCLRIIVNHSRVFIAPPENVVGVYTELVGPDGDVLEYLEPGYIDREGPVPSPYDDDTDEEPVPNPPTTS